MRIAYLTADFGVPVLGTKGASAHVRGLVQALRAEGHDVVVLAANIGAEREATFPLRQVPFGGALLELYDALQNEAICQGTRLAKDFRNLLYASCLAQQGRVLFEEFAPDLIYERYCLFSTAGRELARDFDIPMMVELNAPLVVEQRKMRGLSLPRVALAAERIVLTGADHVVAVSPALHRYALGIGVAADRITVIPNAADPEVFNPALDPAPARQLLGWTDRFVIGFAGSIKPWHGVDTLLQALRLLGGPDSQFRLLLVGSGPELPHLQEQSQQLGLADAVHMTGDVPHEAVPDWLRAMDVAVVSYAADADEYFSPVKLFEYMAMALPVVAARIGQVCDIVDAGRTGWLYTPGDAGELANLIRTLEADGELRQTVGAAARECVMNEHTWRHNARRVLGIAEDLIRRRTSIVRHRNDGPTLESLTGAVSRGGVDDADRPLVAAQRRPLVTAGRLDPDWRRL